MEKNILEVTEVDFANGKFVVDAWEWCPLFGCRTRLVYKQDGKDYVLYGRQYKDKYFD